MTLIRQFREEDAPALWQVYVSSIHGLASADYSPEQISAWAPDDFDPKRWADRVRELSPFIAERSGHVIGYGDVQEDGYIDHFFVAAEAARQGVGSLLMGAIHDRAAAMSIGALSAQVSLTARPFFAKWGFHVERPQTLTVRGVTLDNFSMRKLLSAGV